MGELKKRKSENPLFTEKWSPGLSLLKVPSETITVGQHYRLESCIILGHMQYKLDEVESYQQELQSATVERLKQKFLLDEDLQTSKIEKYESIIGLKFEKQLNDMRDVLTRLHKTCNAKFKTTKKTKNKNQFKTDENDAFLDGKWDMAWVELFPPSHSNKAAGLPQPAMGGKSRQSILSGSSLNKPGPPSVKKGTGFTFVILSRQGCRIVF